MQKSKGLYAIILILLIITSIQILKLNDNYGMGDDFAQFILQSKALFGNIDKEYNLQTELNDFSDLKIGPNAYPVGFPLMLKSLNLLNLEEFKYYKLINILIFNLFIFVTFLILESKSNFYAFVVCLLIISSNEIFLLSNSIESDLLFSLSAVTTIYFINSHTKKLNILFGLIVAFLSILIKTQALILLGIVTFYLYKNSKLKNYIITYLTFGMLYSTFLFSKYKFIFGEYEGHLRQFSPTFNNFTYNLSIISKSFLPNQVTNKFTISLLSAIILLILISTIKNFTYYGLHGLLIIVYFLFYSAYLNQQGIRFLILIIPSLFFILYDLIKPKKYLIFVVVFLFILNVVNYKAYEYEMNNSAFKEENVKMYKYIEANINETDYIAFHKPRLLRLTTKRKAVYLDQSSLSKKPSYVLVEVENKDSFMREFENTYIKIKNFEDYILFKKK